MPEADDRLSRAVAGDEQALTELLLEHGPVLRRRIERSMAGKWRSVLEADDVLQVTYLEAFLRIGHFVPRGDGSFGGWLRRIAENNLRDAVRELGSGKRPQPERRVAAVPENGESAAALLEHLGATTTTASRHAARDEMSAAVDAVLDRMPADYARVVRAYDLEGRPIEAVAAELERSQGAVYMLRARAHDRMKELLGSQTKYFTNPS